jgi:transposase
MRFDLSEEEWAVLQPLMPKARQSARPDDRKIMNAIFYVLRTGIPWRDLPERYGPYTSAYNRFNRWSRPGRNSPPGSAITIPHDPIQGSAG